MEHFCAFLFTSALKGLKLNFSNNITATEADCQICHLNRKSPPVTPRTFNFSELPYHSTFIKTGGFKYVCSVAK